MYSNQFLCPQIRYIFVDSSLHFKLALCDIGYVSDPTLSDSIKTICLFVFSSVFKPVSTIELACLSDIHFLASQGLINLNFRLQRRCQRQVRRPQSHLTLILSFITRLADRDHDEWFVPHIFSHNFRTSMKRATRQSLTV